MKNLSRIHAENHQFQNCSNLNFLKILISEQADKQFDNSNKKIFLIDKKGKIYQYFENSQSPPNLIYELTGGSDINVVNAELLVLNDELCLAAETGEVFIFNLNTDTGEEVTYCDGGIAQMQWSPDQEICVFITKSKKMVTMTSTYDPISEVELNDYSSFGEGEFITVGWGKKETQFHGSEGKQAAKQKLDFKPPENLDSLPEQINISWRGDGEFFAVSFVGVYGRMFKVFNKEGLLQFTSEKLHNLGSQIAWKPSGAWIAVPHKLQSGKYTIGLFEKNGLRHREILLPFKLEDEEITNLEWSSDSDVLSVITKQLNKCFLYLFTVSNYHWYLKQFHEYDEQVLDIKWDINREKVLHILFTNGIYHIYRYCQIINASEIDKSQALVSVIDGKSALLTDFRNKIIPPPMYSYEIINETYISHCGFLRNYNDSENDYINNVYIVDSANEISLYQLKFDKIGSTITLKDAKLFKKFKIIDSNTLTSHWMWISLNKMIFLKESSSKMCLIDLNDLKVHEVSIDHNIGSMTDVSSDEFAVNSFDGKLKYFKILNNNFETIEVTDGSFFEHIKITKTSKLKKPAIIGLQKPTGFLYFNGKNIAQDVTSFSLTEEYVVFTQLNSIKFYRLCDEKICDERKIERGGKIILIVGNDYRTILQMPRGNLEVIMPRILSLELIGILIDNLEYQKAMDLLRKQRINLNIIIDHNPELFLMNRDKFLQQISNLQWLNLFLTDLYNEDFTKTMYSSNYAVERGPYPDDYDPINKVNYVCEKLCNDMEIKNLQYFLLPIITTYVKRNNLENALTIIWDEKKKEAGPIINSEMPKSEEALKYLLYMVDVNKLYDVALGLYNFGLVLYIASKSQKDPKVYVPFLNELQKLDENYRKFKIDEHLKRYEKALEHVSNCNEEIFNDEIIPLVKKYNLYQKSLQIFKNERKNKICLMYGDYLRSQGKLENASIMYERGGDLNQAIFSAKHVLDWRRCLMLSSKIYLNDQNEYEKFCLTLAHVLEENDKFEGAFELLKLFPKQFEQGILSLLKGRNFLKAIFEAKMNKPELVETKIIPELKLYATILNNSIESDKNLFLKYKNRLKLVRTLKLNSEYGDLEEGIDESDLLSDTTSMNSSARFTSSSNRTGKTFRSSKNRRKHERKLLSLKEGNPYEDIAIIDFLHNLVTKIFDNQQHIRDVCKALIEIYFDETGKGIQNSYKALLKEITISLDEIWLPTMELKGEQSLVLNSIDFTQYQNEQHYRLMEPLKRFKPQLNLIDWEHDILK